METYYLACDLGAESGRLMLGSLANDRLSLRELHRFSNTPIKQDGHLCWNIPALVQELKQGLRKAAELKLPICSISADSWGVDYILFDKEGKIIAPTFHYRDSRSKAGFDRTLGLFGWPEIFAQTGIQLMPINTIFQLASESPEGLRAAQFLLGVADGFNYLLSGVAKTEVSMASTFQLYNPVERNWAAPLLDGLELPRRLFTDIIPSGTILGRLLPEWRRETGLPDLLVTATCSHDTGAAVVGAPALSKNWAYISSGTWSLMGVERDAPILSERCRELNFTNEIGYGGSVRLLKNIIGLWIVQECRRQWQREGRDLDYAELTRLAAEAPPFVSLINPGSPEFLAPEKMGSQIADFCSRTNQDIPSSEGAVTRAVLESLALLYRLVLEQIEELTGAKIEVLHIVGGGSRNALLNQFTANACRIPVVAGPDEATAAGNVLIQALALGHLPDIAHAREIVRSSCEMRTHLPEEPAEWEAQFKRFKRLLAPSR